MPPIEADIRTHLASSTTTAGQRFYYDPAPIGVTKPYGHISIISTVKLYHQTGEGIKRSRVQVSCYGANHVQAKTLAEEVEAAMEVFTNCQRAFFENETHMQNEDTKHIALDFFVWR